MPLGCPGPRIDWRSYDYCRQTSRLQLERGLQFYDDIQAKVVCRGWSWSCPSTVGSKESPSAAADLVARTVLFDFGLDIRTPNCKPWLGCQRSLHLIDVYWLIAAVLPDVLAESKSQRYTQAHTSLVRPLLSGSRELVLLAGERLALCGSWAGCLLLCGPQVSLTLVAPSPREDRRESLVNSFD